MKLKKTSLVTMAALAVMTAGIVGATQISAQEGENNEIFLFRSHKANHMSSLVKKLAEKFDLSESEVQSVFDEHRKDMESQMETNYEDRLSQFVEDGKITEEQKELIQQKHDEIKSSMQDEWEEMKDLSPEDRKAQMQAKHDELKSWAEENNVDPKYLMFAMKFHKGGPHRGMMFKSSSNDEAFEVQLQ